MNTIRLVSISLLIFSLSACTSIPLKTLYHLSKTDLMTVNPSHLQVATRVPNGLQEGEKGIELSFSSSVEGKKEKQKSLNLKLEKITDSATLMKVKDFTKANYTTQLYKISEKDIQRLKRFRAEYKKTKAVLGDNLNGEFSVSANYCRSRKISNQPVLVSTWIQTNNNVGLLALVTDYNLREEMEKDNQSFDNILPLCGKEKQVKQ